MPRRSSRTSGRVARILHVIAASVPLVAAALGWLYWLRRLTASWGGPRLSDALPLDALAQHASIPLIVFIVVFAMNGTLLGVYVQRLHFRRVSGALTLTASVWLVYYVFNAISLFTVDQVPLSTAFHSALSLQSAYLAAALAGLAGAFFGREPELHGISATGLTLYATVLCGLFDVISAVIPRSGGPHNFFSDVVSGFLPPIARTLVVPVGVLILITTRGLGRRSRSAWRLAVLLLGISAVLDVLHNLDYAAALVAGVTAILLVAQRLEFQAVSAPSAHPRAGVRFFSMVALAFVFGVATRVIHNLAVPTPHRMSNVFAGALEGLVGLGRVGHGVFSWFIWSEASIVLIGVGWALLVWTAPWRFRSLPDDASRERAMQIVRRFGADALAPFAMRHDKSLFFWPPAGDGADQSQSVCLAYRVVLGVAVVAGDPIGPGDLVPAALTAFQHFAHSRGWRIVILGVAAPSLGMYEDAGFHTLYHGNEAVIDTSRFSLDGSAMRAVRQATHRLARNGYKVTFRYAGDADDNLREELRAIEQSWLGDRAQTGFVMQFDDLFCIDHDDALFAIGRDDQGAVAGFMHFAVCRPSGTLSLSSMPRRGDTPNGFNAWLIVETTRWAASNGFNWVSLNFSPFAGLFDTEARLSSLQRAERGLLLGVKNVLSLQLDNLQRFNHSFRPEVILRYVVYERAGELPRVIAAAMAAEGYLPFSQYLRGLGNVALDKRVPRLAKGL